jgi:hypothetical protein
MRQAQRRQRGPTENSIRFESMPDLEALHRRDKGSMRMASGCLRPNDRW